LAQAGRQVVIAVRLKALSGALRTCLVSGKLHTRI